MIDVHDSFLCRTVVFRQIPQIIAFFYDISNDSRSLFQHFIIQLFLFYCIHVTKCHFPTKETPKCQHCLYFYFSISKETDAKLFQRRHHIQCHIPLDFIAFQQPGKWYHPLPQGKWYLIIRSDIHKMDMEYSFYLNTCFLNRHLLDLNSRIAITDL